MPLFPITKRGLVFTPLINLSSMARASKPQHLEGIVQLVPYVFKDLSMLSETCRSPELSSRPVSAHFPQLEHLPLQLPL